MQLNLKKFDITSISDDNVVVIIGKRNTGKSYIVRDLLKYHRDIPIGTVVSPTESANKFYGDIIPSLFIHEEVSPELLTNVVKRQQLVIKKIHKDEAILGKGSCKIDPRAFLILDDCMYDSQWIKDKNIRYLFLNGRHVRMFFILCMQYALGLPPVLRCQIDIVIILREQIMSNRKRIYDNYAGMFPNFEVFCQVMDQTTENYECLVIKNNARSNKLEDQVFWYKAESHQPYTMCSKEFWEISESICAQNDDLDDDELFDASRLKQKRGPFINVKKGS